MRFLLINFSILMAARGCSVTVQQGALQGEELDLVTGDGSYCSFKGIPYAQPPIGALRFKLSRPAFAWRGVKNATKHGSVCPNVDTITNELTIGDEDCLFLNVYTPDLTPDTALDVLVYIHGGGFKSGSGNVALYGPDFLVRKNLVVVTMNYRLDVLGFLSLGTKTVPGNNGLKDQVLAMKWVKKNIRQFGGDPCKVTIMGESVGGISVAMHLASPMSAGLFHRAIAMSGSPYNDWCLSFKPEMRAFKLGKQLGLETRDPEKLLTFLRQVAAVQLVNYTAPNVMASEEITASLTKMIQFNPVVEKYCGKNSFLCEDLLERKFNHVNKADLMFGYTNEETLSLHFRLLVERYDNFVENFAMKKICDISPPAVCLEAGQRIRDHYFGNKSLNADSMREFITHLNDASYKYDIVRYYSQFPNHGKKYMYQFSSLAGRNQYGSVDGAEYGIYGAAHLDDLRYVFDPKSLNYTLLRDSVEFEIIDRFTTLIKNFITSGNPTPSESELQVTWPQFNSRSMKYLDIGTPDLTIASVNNEGYFRFWLRLLQSIGIIY